MARRTAAYSPDEAVSARIEGAARGPAKTLTISDDNRADGLLANPSASKAAEAAERRSAALTVADMLMTHPCDLDPDNGVTVCTRPGHDEDAAAVRELLEVFGLAERRTEQPGPDWYTPARLAEECGVSLRTATNWVVDKKVRSAVDPNDLRRRLVHPDSAARKVAECAARREAS